MVIVWTAVRRVILDFMLSISGFWCQLGSLRGGLKTLAAKRSSAVSTDVDVHRTS